MVYIREMMLTPHQAHELFKLGFVPVLVTLFCGDRDLYRVGVRS